MDRYESLSLEDINLMEELENNPNKLINLEWYNRLTFNDKVTLYNNLFTNIPFKSQLTKHRFRNFFEDYTEYSHKLNQPIDKKFINYFVSHLREMNITITNDDIRSTENRFIIVGYYLYPGLDIKVTINKEFKTIFIDCYY